MGYEGTPTISTNVLPDLNGQRSIGLWSQGWGNLNLAPKAVTAAGSATGDATVINQAVSWVLSDTATKGVRLNSNVGFGVVANDGTDDTFELYPPTGMIFNALAADAPITIADDAFALFFRVSATEYVAVVITKATT